MKPLSQTELFNYLSKNTNCLLLETNRKNASNKKSLLFTNPIKIVSCHKLANVRSTLKRISDFCDKGYYAAGFISYEAGEAFEGICQKKKTKKDIPYIQFGIYRKPYEVESRRGYRLIRRELLFKISNMKFSLTQPEYEKNIIRIKRLIEKGDTYQVNYTFQNCFTFEGSALGLYQTLRSLQPVSYGAFMKFKDHEILSFSPELFFRKMNNSMSLLPMKGTWHRGITKMGDRDMIKKFKNSDKDKSENVMIVDLLRNDLGRIAENNSVKATKLFHIEKYPTIFQMTSSIKGCLKRGVAFDQIIENIFPSGSVTGAPKISTMKIIKKLEKLPRGIYTGSIGYISPKQKKAVFNIAIRTIDIKDKKGVMGIGSGIVYDSDPKREYEECLLKGQFLSIASSSFFIFETLLWEKGQYIFLEEHLKRMKKTAHYFSYPFSKPAINKFLKNNSKEFLAGKKYRVKIMLDKTGKFSIMSNAIEDNSASRTMLRVNLSAKKTHSRDIFLYYKTSKRTLYDATYKQAVKSGFADSIFTNEKNELTEGCISNLFLKIDEKIYTPYIQSGLLNGVYREYLLSGKSPLKVYEKTLMRHDLKKASNVYIANSVKGLREVKVVF